MFLYISLFFWKKTPQDSNLLSLTFVNCCLPVMTSFQWMLVTWKRKGSGDSNFLYFNLLSQKLLYKFEHRLCFVIQFLKKKVSFDLFLNFFQTAELSCYNVQWYYHYYSSWNEHLNLPVWIKSLNLPVRMKYWIYFCITVVLKKITEKFPDLNKVLLDLDRRTGAHREDY